MITFAYIQKIASKTAPYQKKLCQVNDIVSIYNEFYHHVVLLIIPGQSVPEVIRETRKTLIILYKHIPGQNVEPSVYYLR